MPIDCHYRTDRLQRFELNIFVCVLLKKQFHFWVNYPYNSPRHCMHVVYFVLWYYLIKTTARAVSALAWLAPAAEVKRASETSPDWCDRKYVLRLNKYALLIKKKLTKTAVMSGVANLRLRPCVNALNNFSTLNWKNESPELTSSFWQHYYDHTICLLVLIKHINGFFCMTIF